MRTTLSTSYAHCAIQNIFMLRGKQAAQGAGGRGGGGLLPHHHNRLPRKTLKPNIYCPGLTPCLILIYIRNSNLIGRLVQNIFKDDMPFSFFKQNIFTPSNKTLPVISIFNQCKLYKSSCLFSLIKPHDIF